MEFAKQKTQALNKKDYSEKGSIDPPIQALLERINSFDYWYTTSSCSGRIGVIDRATTKVHASWKVVTHNQAIPADFTEYADQHDLWFIAEAPILHVCCETMQAAQQLLVVAKQAGWGRTCIISQTDTKIMVELLCTGRIETPLAHTTQEYLSYLVECANTKLQTGHKRIETLRSQL